MYWRWGKQAVRKGFWCVKRFKSCNACGVKLQSQNPAKIGFYKPPKASLRPIETAHLRDLKELKYMLFSQGVKGLQEEEQKKKEEFGEHDADEEGPENTKLVCKRCSDALYHNNYDAEGFRRFSAQEVHRFVPKGSNVFHVVSLAQFPFHFDRQLFADPDLSTALLLSKGDLITPDKGLLQRKAPVFFGDFLRSKLKISSGKAVAFSATQKWNVQSVYSVLRGNSYLLGSPNSGKSTLINTLLARYGGRKGDTESGNDRLSANVTHEIGAGVSHLPNMTRNQQSFLVGEKTVNDLPGYSKETQNVSLDALVEPKFLERVRKTHLFSKSKLVKQTYDSLKGSSHGRCYTVSGLFYLIPPAGTINQVINFIPGNEKQYHSLEKALSVVERELNSESGASKQFVGVAQPLASKNNFVRHILPPFQGTVEVVLKDIGHFQLKATGKYEFLGLYEIWVPKGIDVCIREPMVRLIEKGYETHLESRGKKSSFPGKRPVFSSTYPMEFEENATLSQVQEMYLERTKNNLMSRRLLDTDPMQTIGQVQVEPPNLYWYYEW
ncbi:LAME_0F04720g1_1 [Lachancea meyersii CBS 8951]|uniref:Genetic interactor of prohibitins 3, mitochondrial n=1 Tax=Lachancea meyersii CBS 8951 TaxID=1266667 RepID=A0A1G4JS64_9SACH|nr:LAME_0F04720g1_1 [Lachancea meyersii CBS 8951]